MKAVCVTLNTNVADRKI